MKLKHIFGNNLKIILLPISETVRFHFSNTIFFNQSIIHRINMTTMIVFVLFLENLQFASLQVYSMQMIGEFFKVENENLRLIAFEKLKLYFLLCYLTTTYFSSTFLLLLE